MYFNFLKPHVSVPKLLFNVASFKCFLLVCYFPVFKLFPLTFMCIPIRFVILSKTLYMLFVFQCFIPETINIIYFTIYYSYNIDHALQTQIFQSIQSFRNNLKSIFIIFYNEQESLFLCKTLILILIYNRTKIILNLPTSKYGCPDLSKYINSAFQY